MTSLLVRQTVADAPGLRHFDGLADVETEVGRRHQSQGQLAGVQRGLHGHVKVGEPADHAPIGPRQLEAEDELGEHDVRFRGPRRLL